MGFKKINKEESFINAARGETDQKTPSNLKRNKSFLVYFTESELNKVKEEAQKIGMGVNQYIRFKLFS